MQMEDLQREELLRIEHLSVTFTQYDGWFSRKILPVIRDLSLRVSRGEIVAVVGSSGSGKSLLAHAVMGQKVINPMHWSYRSKLDFFSFQTPLPEFCRCRQ